MSVECRDGHFLGVIKKGKTIILAHRHQEQKELPDDDDLHFTIPEAKKFYRCLKELSDYTKEIQEKIGSIKIDIVEIGIHPKEKKWVGITHMNYTELVKEFENIFKKINEGKKK